MYKLVKLLLKIEVDGHNLFIYVCEIIIQSLRNNMNPVIKYWYKITNQ